MTIALFSVPTPRSSLPTLTYHLSSSSTLIVPQCSPSSTTTPAIQEGPSPSPDALAVPYQSGGCKACGREEMEKGCNGEGRIQGGIATVPGFGWWPIKAYRPCPGFVASGGRYRRQGQSMDEVAFGRGPTPPPSLVTPTDSNPSNQKEGQKKIKI